MTCSKLKKGKSIGIQINRLFIIMSILFVFLCLFINRSMQKTLLTNASEHMMITAQKLENQLEFLYDKMDTFSMGIMKEENVQRLMSVAFPDKTRLIYPVEDMITYYKVLDPSIIDISFVNEEVHYSTMYNYEDLDAFYHNWGKGTYGWIGARKSSFVSMASNPVMLLYGRKIMEQDREVGLMILSIDCAVLMLNETDEMNSYYMLADEDSILYALNGTQEMEEQIWKTWKEKNLQSNDFIVNSKEWLIRSTYSERMGCYQISALDMNYAVRNMRTMQKLVWGCVLLTVVFGLLFFGLIDMEVVRPLRGFHGIIRQIRQERQRNLKEELKPEGCMEIKELEEEFTGMLSDIEALNRQIFDTTTDLYEMKVLKQQAELSYMRSQIDPHFLYNTLEAFRMMALDRNAPEMAQMAVDMGNIFRYSTKGDTMVMLEEEISIIQSYIRIQKTRFQGKIEVFYFLPKETLNIRVMKMILQPLVENSIYHGLEPKEGKGTLYIGAVIEDRDLILTIKDDGVGIAEEKLREISVQLEAGSWDTSRHVGILNTQARIRLQCGKPYGIKLESRETDGTTVTIRMPVDKEEEKNDVSGIDCG